MAVSKDTIKLAVQYVSLSNEALKLAQELLGDRKDSGKNISAKAAAAQELLVKTKTIEPTAVKQASRVLGTHEGTLDVLCNILSESLKRPAKVASLGQGANSPSEAPAEKAAGRVVHTGVRVPVGQRDSDQQFHSRMMRR